MKYSKFVVTSNMIWLYNRLRWQLQKRGMTWGSGETRRKVIDWTPKSPSLRWPGLGAIACGKRFYVEVFRKGEICGKKTKKNQKPKKTKTKINQRPLVNKPMVRVWKSKERFPFKCKITTKSRRQAQSRSDAFWEKKNKNRSGVLNASQAVHCTTFCIVAFANVARGVLPFVDFSTKLPLHSHKTFGCKNKAKLTHNSVRSFEHSHIRERHFWSKFWGGGSAEWQKSGSESTFCAAGGTGRVWQAESAGPLGVCLWGNKMNDICR